MNQMMSIIIPILEWVIYFGIVSGFSLFFWIAFSKKEREFLAGIAGIGCFIGFLGLISWVLATFFTPYNSKNELYLWGIGLVIGLIIAIILERQFLHIFEGVTSKATKKSGLERDKKTDIRKLVDQLTKLKEYDPKKYFKDEKGVWFFGLDEKAKPIYVTRPANKPLPHVQISGANGSGKTVLMGVMATQFIKKGETTIIFDPKQGGDEFFPNVCRKAAEQAGAIYRFIDLRKDEAQLNVLDDATPTQIENLLINTFTLEDRGEAADIYRGADRDAAGFVGLNYRKGQTIKEISAEYDSYFRTPKDKSGITASGFANQLKEIARVKSINASSGISLKNAMENGEVIYIAGDWEDAKVVKAQRMVLARIVQLASERDNTVETPKPVAVILDEFSFQISKLVGDSLRIIRDKGLHFVLAHQGINDLKCVPENMNGEQFAGSVTTNCTLKFTYRSVDAETAEYYSNLSGEVLVDDEIRHIDKSLSLTDTVSGERQVRQTERNLIDKNTMLLLPDNCGVLFGNGLATLSHVYPVKVQKAAEARQTESFDSPGEDEKQEFLIPDLE